MEAPTATPTPPEEESPDSEDAVEEAVADMSSAPVLLAVAVREEEAEEEAANRTFIPLIGIPYTVIAESWTVVVVAVIEIIPETAKSFAQLRLAPAVTMEVHCEGNDGFSNPVLERLYPVGQQIVCVVESTAEVRTS